MKFQSGVLGAVIIAVALIGTVFSGFILNIDKSTETVTAYDYVTDVSPLFNYTEMDDFIVYNPIKNLTGYVSEDNTGSGISYTESAQVNQYMVVADSWTNTYTESVGSTFTNDISLTPPNGGSQYRTVVHYASDYGSGLGLYLISPNAIKLSSAITHYANIMPSGTTTINITPDGYNTSTNAVGFIKSSSGTNAMYSQTSLVGTAGNYTTYYYKGFVYDNNAYHSVMYSYDMTSGVTTSIIDGVVSVINPDNTYIVWTSGSIGTTYDYTHINPISLTTTTNIQVSYVGTTYHYLDPKQGVSIDASAGNSTVWSNGQVNGVIDLVVGATGSDNSNMITVSHTNGTDSTITLTRLGGINYVNSTNVGTWSHYLLRIDAISGAVKVIPIALFSNYQVCEIALNTEFDVGNISAIPIDSLIYSQSSNSYTFTVADTSVAIMKKLIMTNPSINIVNYFPESAVDGWRLWFTSFVTTGTSITVNGQLFGIADGYISHDNGTYKITNMSVDFDPQDNHVYIVFHDTNRIIDCGTITNNVISMAGNWYFSTSYYDGHTSTKDVYINNWENAFSGVTALVIFLGLLIVGVIVGYRYFSMKPLDLVIVVGASIIIVAVMEVLQ